MDKRNAHPHLNQVHGGVFTGSEIPLDEKTYDPRIGRMTRAEMIVEIEKLQRELDSINGLVSVRCDHAFEPESTAKTLKRHFDELDRLKDIHNPKPDPWGLANFKRRHPGVEVRHWPRLGVWQVITMHSIDVADAVQTINGFRVVETHENGDIVIEEDKG